MELRPLLPADEPAMVELLTNERISKTYMLPDFETREAAIPLFRRLLALSLDGDHFVRGICAGGQLVGFLNDVWIRDGVIELGYVIHPAHQGRGYATAALKAAIVQLFRLGYREVMAGSFAENAASLRVMEKAGMQPVPETEEIEYRGRVHLCVYRSVSALALATPTLPELAFRKALLADPQTMSYNRAWAAPSTFPKIAGKIGSANGSRETIPVISTGIFTAGLWTPSWERLPITLTRIPAAGSAMSLSRPNTGTEASEPWGCGFCAKPRRKTGSRNSTTRFYRTTPPSACF